MKKMSYVLVLALTSVLGLSNVQAQAVAPTAPSPAQLTYECVLNSPTTAGINVVVAAQAELVKAQISGATDVTAQQTALDSAVAAYQAATATDKSYENAVTACIEAVVPQANLVTELALTDKEAATHPTVVAYNDLYVAFAEAYQGEQDSLSQNLSAVKGLWATATEDDKNQFSSYLLGTLQSLNAQYYVLATLSNVGAYKQTLEWLQALQPAPATTTP